LSRLFNPIDKEAAVSLSPEREAQVLRLYHAERWRIGTIATQLGLHHGTVTRVLAQAGLPRIGAPARASLITFCTIRSYLATLHKQGANCFHALTLAFQGQPPQPRFA